MRKEKQLFNYLKCKVMNKKFYWLAGFAALMMTAACSDDNVVNDNPTPDPDVPEVNEYVGEMTMYDAASQAGRVHVYPQTRALKSERLSLVATVDVPTPQKEYNWSVTSLYFDVDKSFLYATWHSNMQATTGAVPEVWGGAFDVYSINTKGVESDTEEITEDYFEPELIGTGVATDMKFEHVMRKGNNLFISGTQVKNGGGVARVDVSRVGYVEELPYEIIGFPGSSVNATAETTDGKIIAISGYTGTFGTFADDIEAGPYQDAEGNNRAELNLHDDKPRVDWGGKYVTADGKYMLRDGENEAIIIQTDNLANFPLGYKLLSAARSAEKYEVDENGKFLGWELVNGTEAQKYGKHVLVVRNGYAYVAAGWNGLRVHNLNAGGEEVRWQTQEAGQEQNDGPYTTGLFADDEYLYAATSQGLRVYTFKEDGGLELFAFEVENYDENGAPERDEDGNYQPAETETAERHSCNFVVAGEFKDGSKYIYVAYGKSGIRMYKLNPDAEETTKPE